MDINITTSDIIRLTETAFSDADSVTLMDGTYAVTITATDEESTDFFGAGNTTPAYIITDVTGGEQEAGDTRESLAIAAEFIADAVEDDAANAADWAEARAHLLGMF